MPELAAVECRTRISCGQIYIYMYTYNIYIYVFIYIYIYVMYKNDAEQIYRSSNLAQVAELYPIHKVFHPPKKKNRRSNVNLAASRLTWFQLTKAQVLWEKQREKGNAENTKNCV